MWQPIETAPKGEVLLYFPPKVAGAYAQSTLPAMIRVGWASDFPNRIPSHWMPLPAPPSTEPLTKEQAEDLTRRAT